MSEAQDKIKEQRQQEVRQLNLYNLKKREGISVLQTRKKVMWWIVYSPFLWSNSMIQSYNPNPWSKTMIPFYDPQETQEDSMYIMMLFLDRFW